MKISHRSVEPIDFDGLKILDYTSEIDLSSSIAEITVPPGVKHKTAWSKRSDKYYYIVSGSLQFTVANETFDLDEGDTCIIEQGERFSYCNIAKNESKLVLVHTPGFDLNSEVFEE